jgi:hypothetical protein
VVHTEKPVEIKDWQKDFAGQEDKVGSSKPRIFRNRK